MKDGVDTNTRRYRILARLALADTSVAPAGDDMFDLVCRNAGALRFKLGSALARGQTVALFATAIEQRLVRVCVCVCMCVCVCVCGDV